MAEKKTRYGLTFLTRMNLWKHGNSHIRRRKIVSPINDDAMAKKDCSNQGILSENPDMELIRRKINRLENSLHSGV